MTDAIQDTSMKFPTSTCGKINRRISRFSMYQAGIFGAHVDDEINKRAPQKKSEILEAIDV